MWSSDCVQYKNVAFTVSLTKDEGKWEFIFRDVIDCTIYNKGFILCYFMVLYFEMLFIP